MITDVAVGTGSIGLGSSNSASNIHLGGAAVQYPSGGFSGEYIINTNQQGIFYGFASGIGTFLNSSNNWNKTESCGSYTNAAITSMQLITTGGTMTGTIYVYQLN